MTNTTPVRIIMPPNRLKQKVGNGDPEMADTTASEFRTSMMKLERDYAVHLKQQLSELRALANRSANNMASIFTVAHQIRGECPHFGYSGVACIAHSLCEFIEASRQTLLNADAVILLHVDAMIILKQDNDDNGEIAASHKSKTLHAEITKAANHVLTMNRTGTAEGSVS